MKLSTRELVTLAVFGALWGVVEISLGSVLKSLQIPFSGALLAAIGLIIALIGRLFVPRRGTTLFIGVIAMVLKLFSIGSIIVGPMIGIMMEAILAELVLSAFSKPRLVSFLLTGMTGVLWTLLQHFFTGMLLWGREIFVIWLDLLDMGGRIFGLSTHTAWAIVLLLVIVNILIGSAGGWLAWITGRLLLTRMSRKTQ